MPRILNLTQHPATDEQRADGVEDLPDEARRELGVLLTFVGPPTAADMWERAEAVATLALRHGVYDVAMIGGAPYFLEYLRRTLDHYSIRSAFAFSERESIEAIDPDGSVTKKSVFRHRGFVFGD